MNSHNIINTRTHTHTLQKLLKARCCFMRVSGFNWFLLIIKPGERARIVLLLRCIRIIHERESARNKIYTNSQTRTCTCGAHEIHLICQPECRNTLCRTSEFKTENSFAELLLTTKRRLRQAPALFYSFPC